MWGGWVFHVGKLFPQLKLHFSPKSCSNVTIVRPNGTCVNYRDPCPTKDSWCVLESLWGLNEADKYLPRRTSKRKPSRSHFQLDHYCKVPGQVQTWLDCQHCTSDAAMHRIYLASHFPVANILIIKRPRVPMRPKQQRILTRQFKMSQSCCFFLSV